MNSDLHTFHIPVLGLGYSIDTPLKVARFGISSVVSIVEDELVEQMRQLYAQQYGEAYNPIPESEEDSRARRITAYLDLMHRLVQKQTDELRALPFDGNNDIDKYFSLLPDASDVKQLYNSMQCLSPGEEKAALQEELRSFIQSGSIDVNIMAKVDNLRYDKKGNALPVEYSDALSALRGFANSTLESSIVFSAGYNPRLYNYLESFKDFFPDANGSLKKKIIIKVSDYRSALLQGKILAKRGLWVSEFRIESGLNCGGHAFATDGLLLGPILEEFKENREKLASELFSICKNAAKDRYEYKELPTQYITVQGGIGTAFEQQFLLEHYKVDRTGWGSPFLLVPEATNVDDETLQQLATAEQTDYFLSNASPLGVPFNNFRKSSSEAQRKERIEKGRPGSPCYKKYLVSNTEYTDLPICTASRQYQRLKIAELTQAGKMADEEIEMVTQKDCLCEGLTVPALLKNGLKPSHKLTAVTICPGPNLAYFSGIFSLKEMVGHIYGRCNLLNALPRSNMFINELRLYIDFFQKHVAGVKGILTAKQVKYADAFKKNLESGIDYYQKLVVEMHSQSEKYRSAMQNELENISAQLEHIELLPAASFEPVL